MTDLFASAFKSNFGLQLLQWAVSQSDIWHLAHRCSELAQKINEPLEKSAYVLDNLSTMDEDDINCIHNLQGAMHFDNEDYFISQDYLQRNYYNQRQQNISIFSSRNHFQPQGKRFSFFFYEYTCEY